MKYTQEEKCHYLSTIKTLQEQDDHLQLRRVIKYKAYTQKLCCLWHDTCKAFSRGGGGGGGSYSTISDKVD